jgi:hypothetical protein
VARILLCEDFDPNQGDLEAGVQSVAEEQVTEALRLLINAVDATKSDPMVATK